MKYRSVIFTNFLVILLLALTARTAGAEGCTVSHQECEYVCNEYYPNGTDCKKTRKECHTVCDDFTVDKGGVDDANRGAQQKEEDNE